MASARFGIAVRETSGVPQIHLLLVRHREVTQQVKHQIRWPSRSGTPSRASRIICSKKGRPTTRGMPVQPNDRRRARVQQRALDQIKALGYDVTITPKEPAA